MKNSLVFREFENELMKHSANGYHLIVAVGDEIIEGCDNIEYLRFLKSIGSGAFYGGALQIFSPNDDKFRQFNEELEEPLAEQFLVIGYNGTTEGSFAVKRKGGDSSIYYMNREQPSDITMLSNSFYQWIENSQNEFYDSKLYKAFSNIKEIEKIREVIAERRAIKLDLKYFNENLEAKPNAEKQYLKRYNRLIFEIELTRPVLLQKVTVKMLRTGSSIGDDNIEYVTLSIDRDKNKQIVEAYLFDPFNLPFDKIVSLYNPEINLNSRMRTKYKEILEFL